METNHTSGLTGKMKNSEFHQFFVEELRDIYGAEKSLVSALPKLQKAATCVELSVAFKKHAQETQLHIDTLEHVFRLLEEHPEAKRCDAIEDLLEEADTVIEDRMKGSMTRDAALILIAQKVEHYEIATYGTLRTMAETMGHIDVANLLQQTLENEKLTDLALTKVAEWFVNEQATTE